MCRPHDSRGLLAAPILAAAAVLTLLPGCRYLTIPTFPSAPPPPSEASGAVASANWSLERRAVSGSPVAPDADAAARAGEWRIAVRLVEVADPTSLPAADVPAWIFAKGTDDPLEPAPRFTAGAEGGWASEPLFGELERAAPTSATKKNKASAEDPAPRPPAVLRDAFDVPLGLRCGWSVRPVAGDVQPLELLLWLNENGDLGAALASEGSVPGLELDDAQSAAIGAVDQDLVRASAGREVAPLPASAGRRTLWCRVPTLGGAGLVIEVVATPAPTTGPLGLAHAHEIDALRNGLSNVLGVTMPTPLLVAASENAKQRRALLVELARSTGRALVLDAVLLANDADLTTWVERVANTTDTSALRGSKAAQAWLLERTLLEACANEAELDDLDPSLSAVLRIHLGAIGAEPSLLLDLLRRSKSPAEFESALANETDLLLSDPRPAVRVRATRWLAARGMGPTGFDPLGPRAERRTALDAWRRAREEAQTAAATTNGGATGGSR
ncbi:hypothetical protein Pla163_04410 [Planctomycetes bacterium Pla163]|uniref:Uncharacterized protein n=1 Tax=Rohdeia mirabilis TaxID=2528008 RepID=A0A518CVT1_9BACT|nr:hypothetical protein Pla163_04410 [Planctomycetes bacterium Pla163]